MGRDQRGTTGLLSGVLFPPQSAQALARNSGATRAAWALFGSSERSRPARRALTRGSAVARTIFHGQRGELRQRYREGQEDQLGALGLVVNAVVLWNTRYLDAALAKVRASGAGVKPEDVKRLSPLLLGHINVLGRYEFILKKSIRQGKLRPLRDPNERDDPAA